MIFLDSSNPEEVLKWKNRGVIRGVTTNPSIMKKDGSGKDELLAILDIMQEAPVSIELTTQVPNKMLDQAYKFVGLAKNVNVKVPIHGARGESNLDIIHMLTTSDVDINCTACMSAIQAYLGAEAGAKLVSLFGGRIADMGHDPVAEIRKFRSIVPRGFPGTPLLVMGSVREVHNIVEWLACGADIVTVPPEILEKALVHPRTKETVQQFLEDASRKPEKQDSGDEAAAG